MYVLTYFTENGVPKTGLAPTIEVWRVDDNVKVVNGAAMSEVGGGFYKYNFITYDATKSYGIRCDGGSALSNQDRYSFAGNEGFHDDIKDIQDAVATLDILIRRVLGLSQENYRLFNTSYDITGKQLVGCTIKIYNNKADCDSDINALATYIMASVYGENGQLSSYKVTKSA